MADERECLAASMRQYVDRGELPGMVYLVAQNGESWYECLGSRSIDGPPMTRDTIFRIASLSKPIAAVATLTMIEEGLLSLDQPIDTLLPELSNLPVMRSLDSDLHDTIPIHRPVTIEDLLTFRAGTGIVLALPGTYAIQRATDERELGVGPPAPALPPDPDEWIRRLAELPMIHQPGEGWMYVTSSEILGVLLARAMGKPLPEVFQSRVFDPLGMADTGFYVSEEKTERFATQYIPDEQTGGLVVSDSPADGQWSEMPDFPSAGGGLVSTVEDYATFARMLLNNGVHDGKQLIGSDSVQKMTRNHLTEQQRNMGELILGAGNGWGYCVAVRIEDHTDTPGNVGSYGWNGGLGTTWLNDPAHDLTAILLTQVQWTGAQFPESASKFLRGAYRICGVR
jgi:CubicO group peptidase (beta-lactamase class C family)